MLFLKGSELLQTWSFHRFVIYHPTQSGIVSSLLSCNSFPITMPERKHMRLISTHGILLPALELSNNNERVA